MYKFSTSKQLKYHVPYIKGLQYHPGIYLNNDGEANTEFFLVRGY